MPQVDVQNILSCCVTTKFTWKCLFSLPRLQRRIGNQVQILNRPAAVSPSKIFEYSTSHCPPGGWEGIQRGISQKTCQDNIVLVLSGNKATKH